MIVADIPSWCSRGSRILDLGSGSGRNAVALAQQGYEVDAVDRSPEMIENLRALAAARGLAIRAEVMDVCAPEIDFSRYRVVICTFVLHFLTWHRATSLLDRARSDAAPGTVHAIAAFIAQGDLFDEQATRRFCYPAAGEIAERYRKNGWQVHRGYEELCGTTERRADGTRKQNVASFMLAGC
jgi:cyclopropane fatty-acyl-phospholipid synthase-like methyltransferase